MQNLDTLALDRCSVGYKTDTLVQNGKVNKHPEGYTWVYKNGALPKAFTDMPLQALMHEEVSLGTKFCQFTIGCTVDGLLKIGYNVGAFIGNGLCAVGNLVLAILKIRRWNGSARVELKAFAARVFMMTSNAKEIVFNATRAIPIIGHFAGHLTGRAINWIGKRGLIAQVLKHKFALEFQLHCENRQSDELLEVQNGHLVSLKDISQYPDGNQPLLSAKEREATLRSDVHSRCARVRELLDDGFAAD